MGCGYGDFNPDTAPEEFINRGAIRMGEKPEVKVIERKRWRVIIPKGSSGGEVQKLFYRHVGHGYITIRDIEIEFKHPQEEEMYG